MVYTPGMGRVIDRYGLDFEDDGASFRQRRMRDVQKRTTEHRLFPSRTFNVLCYVIGVALAIFIGFVIVGTAMLTWCELFS